MSELKHYECHKEVDARPMPLGEYNEYRGWQLPEDEDPARLGYLVIYNKDTPDHYESWSPKEVFDDGYSETT